MTVSSPTPLAERLEAIRRAHVPDSRLGVWDVMVEGDGRPRILGWTTAEAAIREIRDAARGSDAVADVAALPDPALGAAILGTAHRSLAHVRREPRHASELVSQILMGEEVLCLRAEGEWLQVQSGDGYVGWIHRGSLVRSEPREEPAAFRARLAEGRPEGDALVLVARAPLAREGPGPDAPGVADLVQGGRVRPGGDPADGSRPILLPDGATAWIPLDDVVPWDRLSERFPADGSAILAHAAEHLGTPYLWGGTSERGFDCSGLIQRTYALHGIRLPRDSDQQAAAGAPVAAGGSDWGAALDGDLAFFHDTPGGRATHVGILARGGRMLHASTTRGGVAWDALDPSLPDRSEFGALLASRLSAVRRVLP